MARGLKFSIYEVEGLYCLCSENKGTDQLRGYREADLLLCFRICKKPDLHDATHVKVTYQANPSKAVVGVERPMYALSYMLSDFSVK